jgi:sugar fermentation stimulation protein A
VSTAADIDPAYAKGLEKARQSGVEILCYRCNVMLESIELDKEIPHAPGTLG